MKSIRKIKIDFFAVLLLSAMSVTIGYSQKIYNNSTQNDKAAFELKIIDKINQLPEVKHLQEEVKKNSGGKRRVFAAIYERPAGDFKYYWVRVWQDNGENYAGVFNFYVDPGSFAVKCYDIDNDKTIDLKTWRKQYK